MRTSTIYAVRNDRLGGRLNAILNSMRVTTDYGGETAIFWPRHQDVSSELHYPEELFDHDHFYAQVDDEITYHTLMHEVRDLTDLPRDMTAEAFRAELASGATFRCIEALKPIILPWENPEDIAARMPQVLREVRFSPVVQKAMQQVDQALEGSRLLAYHIRRGDIIDPDSRPSQVLWPSKYIPRVFYERHLQAQLETGDPLRAIIFSDEPREYDAMREISPQVVNLVELVGDLTLTELQRDFIELYAMSCCETIVGPGASAFSSVAATLGNTSIVDVREALSPEQVSEALCTLSARLKDGPHHFMGDADLGQNFRPLLDFHRARGDTETAASIIKKYIGQGLDRSYAYDLLAEACYYQGDADGALAVVDLLRTRPIYTALANPLVYTFAALACINACRLPESRSMTMVANWAQPIHPLVRRAVGSLTCAGLLKPNQHYPLDVRLARPLRLASEDPRHPDMRLKAGIEQMLEQRGLPPQPPSLIPFEIDLRDWVQIQSAQLPPGFFNPGKIERAIHFMRSTFSKQIDEPFVLSALGRLYLSADDTDMAEQLLDRALEAEPDNALFVKRKADFHEALDDHTTALDLAERAHDLSSGQVCFAADLARRRFILGDKQAALSLIADVGQQDHEMIELRILAADLLRRDAKLRPLALDEINKAASMMAGANRIMRLKRKILEQLGRQQDVAQIDALFDQWRRPLGGFKTRVKKL